MPTQSQETPRQSDPKTSSPSQHLDSAPVTLPLQLSVNLEDDSQATQIEELDEPPGVDTSDSVSKSNGVLPESAKPRGDSGEVEQCSQSQSSELQNRTETSQNPQHEPVTDSADKVSCSQAPPDGSHASAVEATTTSHVLPQPGAAVGAEGEVVMEAEEERSGGGGVSGMALVLSESQRLSPEPMEEEGEARGPDSVIVVTDSEREPPAGEGVMSQSDTPPPVSTNGHESQLQEASASPERAGLQPEALSDSSGGRM